MTRCGRFLEAGIVFRPGPYPAVMPAEAPAVPQFLSFFVPLGFILRFVRLFSRCLFPGSRDHPPRQHGVQDQARRSPVRRAPAPATRHAGKGAFVARPALPCLVFFFVSPSFPLTRCCGTMYKSKKKNKGAPWGASPSLRGM